MQGRLGDPTSTLHIDAARGKRSFDTHATRLLDIGLSIALTLFFLPIMLTIVLVTFCVNPGPVLFAQLRVGRGGRLFKCYKFRTMAVNAEERLIEVLHNDTDAAAEWARDHKLRDDPRILGIGYFLRRSSLDELPQFFNVLRGDMGIVGPRPIVPSEIARYGHYFSCYCSVRPGITGLWQISGRNDVTYRRRVAYDVAYSRARSVSFDIKIISYTIPSMIFAKGSY